MGLFQRRQENSVVSSLYTVGLNNTLAIIGLGNIGEEYAHTRHNIGFDCLDHFAKANEFPDWVNKKDLKAMISIKTLGDSRLILVKPTTLMNLSGDAVNQVIQYYKIPTSNLLVVHDEIDVVFGKIKSKKDGSSAGHNGVQSIIDLLGEDFNRLRIGIGPKIPERIETADFVLQKFNKELTKDMDKLFLESTSMINEFVFGDRSLAGETRAFII